MEHEMRNLVFQIGPSEQSVPLSAKEVLESFKVSLPVNYPADRLEEANSIAGTGVYRYVGEQGEQYFAVSPSDNINEQDIEGAINKLCNLRGLSVTRLPELPQIESQTQQTQYIKRNL